MRFKELASREVKKHVGAIHIKGKLSLLQRKVANVLLLNAYDDLPIKDKHRIRIKDLAEVAGFDSNNHEVLKDTLRSLAQIMIEWNVLDEKGESDWEFSSFLAGARIRKGVCTYAYSPFLREKLYHPEVYARINLGIQRRFRSGYALALYENCLRFRGTGETKWWSLEKCRDILGIEPYQYKTFKSFSQRVLKPAIQEVNNHSDILLDVEYLREKRRVVALKFHIKDNPQLSLNFDERSDAPGFDLLPAAGGDSQLLFTRLLSFGLSDTQASRILGEYDEDCIAGNLDHIESQLEAGREIKNIPGYTLKAIEDDYRPREIDVERAVGRRKAKAFAERQAQESAQREREEEERREAAARAQRVDDLYASLPAQQQQAIDRQALERMKDEVRFVFTQYEKAKSEGKKIEEMSVVIRSTLRSLRKDLLEEMEESIC